MSDRRSLLDDDDALSQRQQCALLSLSRSTARYEPVAVSDEELALMRAIDEEHMAHPFEGSRMIRDMLGRKDLVVNRKRVQRLMRLMGLVALCPRPGTSRPAPGHKVYPYLLRGLDVVRANQVWATDITYIPMARGFVYLVAIIDWFSRFVLSWRISNTLDTAFCVDALEDALARWGTPSIFNTDQGSQFTSSGFVDVLLREGIQVSMDGKGRWVDNVFVERLWRSLKYEEVYLHAYDDVVDTKRGIGRYMEFFNVERPHQSLERQTPAEVYFASMQLLLGERAAA